MKKRNLYEILGEVLWYALASATVFLILAHWITR